MVVCDLRMLAGLLCVALFMRCGGVPVRFGCFVVMVRRPCGDRVSALWLSASISVAPRISWRIGIALVVTALGSRAPAARSPGSGQSPPWCLALCQVSSSLPPCRRLSWRLSARRRWRRSAGRRKRRNAGKAQGGIMDLSQIAWAGLQASPTRRRNLTVIQPGCVISARMFSILPHSPEEAKSVFGKNAGCDVIQRCRRGCYSRDGGCCGRRLVATGERQTQGCQPEC
jgi:hypothetical protein